MRPQTSAKAWQFLPIIQLQLLFTFKFSTQTPWPWKAPSITWNHVDIIISWKIFYSMTVLDTDGDVKHTKNYLIYFWSLQKISSKSVHIGFWVILLADRLTCDILMTLCYSVLRMLGGWVLIVEMLLREESELLRRAIVALLFHKGDI